MIQSLKQCQWQGLKAVELKTAVFDLIAVYEFGPRIAFLSKKNGKNIFFWDQKDRRRGQWFMRGGHRLWITRPGADENEETYLPDNELCQLDCFENGFLITAPLDPNNMIQKGLKVSLAAEDLIIVDHFMVNRGELLYSGGLWALTCTEPSSKSTYYFPVSDGTSWDAFNLIMFKTWGGHQGGFNDPQIQFTDELMIVKPAGNENKRMFESHTGIGIMVDEEADFVFAKKMTYDSVLNYPRATNWAYYIGPDNFMVEMETMGPEKTLKPGTKIHHVEYWKIEPHKRLITNTEEAVSLFQ